MSAWFTAPVPVVLYVMAGTAAMYLSTLVVVRISGRRTLAQISAFDVVTTVAIGSLLASTAVAKDPSYVQGVTALVTLLALQVLIAALRQRFDAFRRAIDFGPETVFEAGETTIRRGFWTAQVTEDEVRAAMRQAGAFEPGTVRVVVLESDGSFSVGKEPDPIDADQG